MSPRSRAASSSWRDAAPRWLLAFVASVGVLGMLWAAKRWVNAVDAHIAQSVDGYQRLAAVGQQSSQNAEAINALRSELLEMRGDQLAFFRWTMERAGDKEQARLLDERLRDLKRGQ